MNTGVLTVTPLKMLLVAAFLALVGAWMLVKGISNRELLSQPAELISARLNELDAHRLAGRSWYTRICVTLEGHAQRFCRDVRNADVQVELEKAADATKEIVSVLIRTEPAVGRRSARREAHVFGLVWRGHHVWNQARIERQFYFRDCVLWTILGGLFSGLALALVGKGIRDVLRKRKTLRPAK